MEVCVVKNMSISNLNLLLVESYINKMNSQSSLNAKD